MQKLIKVDSLKPKTKLRLVGEDGNAFNILGLALKAAQKAEWAQEKIDEFKEEAKSSDYDHLLQTCFKYFDVT